MLNNTSKHGKLWTRLMGISLALLGFGFGSHGQEASPFTEARMIRPIAATPALAAWLVGELAETAFSPQLVGVGIGRAPLRGNLGDVWSVARFRALRRAAESIYQEISMKTTIREGTTEKVVTATFATFMPRSESRLLGYWVDERDRLNVAVAFSDDMNDFGELKPMDDSWQPLTGNSEINNLLTRHPALWIGGAVRGEYAGKSCWLVTGGVPANEGDILPRARLSASRELLRRWEGNTDIRSWRQASIRLAGGNIQEETHQIAVQDNFSEVLPPMTLLAEWDEPVHHTDMAPRRMTLWKVDIDNKGESSSKLITRTGS